jgi:hypothetical protein
MVFVGRLLGVLPLDSQKGIPGKSPSNLQEPILRQSHRNHMIGDIPCNIQMTYPSVEFYTTSMTYPKIKCWTQSLIKEAFRSHVATPKSSICSSDLWNKPSLYGNPHWSTSLLFVATTSDDYPAGWSEKHEGNRGKRVENGNAGLRRWNRRFWDGFMGIQKYESGKILQQTMFDYRMVFLSDMISEYVWIC